MVQTLKQRRRRKLKIPETDLGARVLYFLNADFNAVDQGYANAQVIEHPTKGVVRGRGTVDEADGTLAIVSNKLAITAQSTPTWGDLGIVWELSGGGAFTKSLGLALIATINLSTWEEMGIGWDDASAVIDPDNCIYAIQANSTDGQLDVEGGTTVYTGLSTNTDYRLFIVCGGFDSNEAPYYLGQTKSSYLYGAHYFLEVDGTIYKIWMKSTDNTSTIHAILSSLDAVGTIDNYDIADKDLSDTLQPTALSTFTADNGTSLDAITPEVGGGWDEQGSNFDIQGNRAHHQGNNVIALATVLTNNSDQIIDVVVQMPIAGLAGQTIRYTDVSNFWFLRLAEAVNQFEIWESDGGVLTLRAFTAVAIGVGVDYNVRSISYGQTIDGFLDGGNKVSYGFATLNETATEHGLFGFRRDEEWDNFACFPRTSSVYDSILDSV